MAFDATLFDTIIDRRGTQSCKWDRPRAQDQLPLFVADMDFAAPSCVTEALQARCAHPVYGYTDATDADVDAFVGWCSARHGYTPAREWLQLMPGVVPCLRQAVLALSQPGDGVVIQPPVYGPFFAAVRDAGRTLVENPLVLENGAWRMDLNQLEDCFRKGARLMLFCNPHNPVGRVWTRQELTDLLALAQRYGARIISDDIHADFELPGSHYTPLLSLDGAATCVAQCVAASKTFNIPGLQQATFILPDETMRKVVQHSVHASGVDAGNLFALVGTRAAYTQGGPWLDALLPYLGANRDRIEAFFREEMPKAICPHIEGTYQAFIDFNGVASPEEITRRLDVPGGVWLSEGTVFGEQYTGWMRISFGCPRALLDEALRRIRRLLS